MEIRFHSSVVFCSDIQKQREFYEKFLSMKVMQDMGACILFEGNFSLWQINNEYPISKELGYSYEPIGNRNLELCFETEAFEDSVEKVLMSDLRILHNVEEEEWGQYTIRFYDPEGNLLEIGESLKCMSKRMHASGMSVEEITKKSGLNKKVVREFLA